MPDYYNGKGGMQPFDVIDAFGLDFYEGNVVKYIVRWRKKGGVEDLRKARTYLDAIIKRAEERAPAGAMGPGGPYGERREPHLPPVGQCGGLSHGATALWSRMKSLIGYKAWPRPPFPPGGVSPTGRQRRARMTMRSRAGSTGAPPSAK